MGYQTKKPVDSLKGTAGRVTALLRLGTNKLVAGVFAKEGACIDFWDIRRLST